MERASDFPWSPVQARIPTSAEVRTAKQLCPVRSPCRVGVSPGWPSGMKGCWTRSKCHSPARSAEGGPRAWPGSGPHQRCVCRQVSRGIPSLCQRGS